MSIVNINYERRRRIFNTYVLIYIFNLPLYVILDSDAESILKKNNIRGKYSSINNTKSPTNVNSKRNNGLISEGNNQNTDDYI